MSHIAAGFICICFFLTTAFSLKAQGILTGKTADLATNTTVGFASVSLLKLKDSLPMYETVSDTAGNFELAGIKNGDYLLRVVAVGYDHLYRSVSLQSVSLNIGQIFLTGDQHLLNEVSVTSRKPPVQRVGDKLVLNIAGNPFYKTAANGFDILKKIPGLQVNGDGTMLLSGRNVPAVFIDGKPTPMSELELQYFLASLTPDMVASIEVIANPSSKYDGEYKAIIDIKLKRDKTLGWNGSITSNIQHNTYTLADNNLAATYKTKKVAYTARLGYAVGSTIYRYSAIQHLANTNIMTTSRETETKNNNFNYQLSIDYDISAAQKIGVWLRAYKADRHTDTHNTLHTTDSTSKILVSDIDTKNTAAPQQHNYAAQLNYSKAVGKKQLQLLAALNSISNRQDDDIQTKERDATMLSDYWKTNLKNDVLIRMLQADLSGSLGKGTFNTGAKFVYTTTKNDLHYDTLNANNHFVTDSGRTNNFQYDEYISALYATYDLKSNKFSYSFGLRAEYTYSMANAVTQNEKTKRNYLIWLPNVNVSYKMNEYDQFNFSFVRRVTRPNFAQLNPFRFYNSPLNYFAGNPYLLPSKTSTLSIAYTHRSLNVSLSAGREIDQLSRYPEYDPVTNILEYLGRNLPYNDFATLEANMPVPLRNGGGQPTTLLFIIEKNKHRITM